MSSPYDLHKSKDLWERLATDAAPIGERAVREHLAKWAGSLGVQIRHIVVIKLDGPGEYKVGVNYMSVWPGEGWRVHEFVVRNPNVVSSEYRHNVDQFLNDKILELVNKVTGYQVAVGDLWVHVCPTLAEAQAQPGNEGMVSFGALTRAGQIAFDRFLEVRGITVPGPDEPQPYHAHTCEA